MQYRFEFDLKGCDRSELKAVLRRELAGRSWEEKRASALVAYICDRLNRSRRRNPNSIRKRRIAMHRLRFRP